ncbi:MAG: endonuclease domain-containing protein [Thermodesulfobacteriota bacterium]
MSKNMRDRSRQLRRKATDAEARLWSHLRARQLSGFKFRRQHAIGSYIVDFYCHEAGLVVELDGGGHAEELQGQYDLERSQWLESRGLRVIRFWNNEVLGNIEGVVEQILSALGSTASRKPPSP